jgi:hypothetical protein
MTTKAFQVPLSNKLIRHAGIHKDHTTESQFQPGSFWERAEEIAEMVAKR